MRENRRLSHEIVFGLRGLVALGFGLVDRIFDKSMSPVGFTGLFGLRLFFGVFLRVLF